MNCVHCEKILGWAVDYCPFCGLPQPQAPKLAFDWLAQLLADSGATGRQNAAAHLRQHYGLAADKAELLARLVVAGNQEIALAKSFLKLQSPAPPLAPTPRQAPTPAEPPAVADIHGWPAHRVQALQRQAAATLGRAVEFQDLLASGSVGPVMVVIPAGRFLMGSPQTEPEREACEGPQHPVVFLRPFTIGKYAVTFAEYDRYIRATGQALRGDSGWGRGNRPAINITWQDAKNYCAWLSWQTGHAYRLPTETEWEYACRAGCADAFHWGDTITPAQANYCGRNAYNGGARGEYLAQTAVAQAYPPNAFGLCQMPGNVWEWCEDIWRRNYRNKRGNGQVWSISGDSSCRAVRGGSWINHPRHLRSAARSAFTAGGEGNDLGFRLVRDL